MALCLQARLISDKIASRYVIGKHNGKGNHTYSNGTGCSFRTRPDKASRARIYANRCAKFFAKVLTKPDVLRAFASGQSIVRIVKGLEFSFSQGGNAGIIPHSVLKLRNDLKDVLELALLKDADNKMLEKEQIPIYNIDTSITAWDCSGKQRSNETMRFGDVILMILDAYLLLPRYEKLSGRIRHQLKLRSAYVDTQETARHVSSSYIS
jgi:hypothetical protein